MLAFQQESNYFVQDIPGYIAPIENWYMRLWYVRLGGMGAFLDVFHEGHQLT